jgi:hypothetical protein
VLAAFHVGEGGVVRGDEAGARAAFDGHVADGHALHGGGADDGIAAVLGDVTDSPETPILRMIADRHGGVRRGGVRH